MKIAKVSTELSQRMLAKRTRTTSDTAALVLITTAQREKSDPQKPQPWLLWDQLYTSLAKSTSGQGHRTKVPLVLSLGPLRKAWVGLAHHLQASRFSHKSRAFHDLRFKVKTMGFCSSVFRIYHTASEAWIICSSVLGYGPKPKKFSPHFTTIS